MYLKAWKGQVGTNQSCDDPEAAWAQAEKVLALAKEG